MRSRIKDLRARVADQKKEIGREPTKASAAKILKTEAQIDAANEKLSRAKKRLVSAQRRLSNAEDDAEIAHNILARDIPDTPKKKSSVPVRTKPHSVVLKAPTPVADIDDTPTETKAEEMADNDEVKPLFDKDPENLDEEIAFKPINFGSVEEEPGEMSHGSNVGDDDIVPAPLSLAAKANEYSEPEKTFDENQDLPVVKSEDVPDNSFEEPQNLQSEYIDNEAQVPVIPENKEPAVVPPVPPVSPVAPAPVEPIDNAAGYVAPVAAVRPVSPIAGNVTPVEPQKQKSTFMYYLMLILLILLSVGTLWLYQKSTSENVPDLAKTVSGNGVVVTNEEVKSADTGTFITPPTIVKETTVEKTESVITPEPVAAPVVKPEPTPATPEPVVVEPEPVVSVQETVAVEPEPIAVQPEPVVSVEPEPVAVVDDSPFVTPKYTITKSTTYEPEPVRIPSEAEIIAKKPGYNVSQNEKMFVASSDYDTETIDTSLVEYDNTNVESTYSMDVDVQPMPVLAETKPVFQETPIPEMVTSEIIGGKTSVVESVGECMGGAPSDEYGCCPGEEFMYTDDGFMCCSEYECFDPMN